jgi:hypothetical protein
VSGPIGRFANSAGLLRLKCSCEKKSFLDITPSAEGKIKLSVPCLFCKSNHSYVVSESVFFDREISLLNCPYSGMDIAFIGLEEKIAGELSRTESEITRLLTGFDAESITDIQPSEMNEDEILPDPAVYDTLRFVVKDLEEEGRVKCLCSNGKYDLRFTDDGIQVFCENCGATYTFKAYSPTIAEEYLDLNELTLS